MQQQQQQQPHLVTPSSSSRLSRGRQWWLRREAFTWISLMALLGCSVWLSTSWMVLCPSSPTRGCCRPHHLLQLQPAGC